MLKYFAIICVIFNVSDAEMGHSNKMVSLQYVFCLCHHDLNCPFALVYSLA